MMYSTYIPKTTAAQRHAAFLAARSEARRSVSMFEALHDAWIKTGMQVFTRNYLDADVLETAAHNIVKLSTLIRKLRPLASQPDVPRQEQATPHLSVNEDRTYGGIKACRLVRVLWFFETLKQNDGNVAVIQRVKRTSDRLINGLDIYKRVKALITKLLDALDAPEHAIMPRPTVKITIPKPSFKWEVSPQQTYRWARTLSRKGYDPRQTSVYWLEKQSVALIRAVYRDYHGIKPAKSKLREHAFKLGDDLAYIQVFTPVQGSLITDQIWPPIDLLKLIEDRKTLNIKPGHSTSEDLPARNKHTSLPYSETRHSFSKSPMPGVCSKQRNQMADVSEEQYPETTATHMTPGSQSQKVEPTLLSKTLKPPW